MCLIFQIFCENKQKNGSCHADTWPALLENIPLITVNGKMLILIIIIYCDTLV